MDLTYNLKEEIIEYLIVHQPYFKAELAALELDKARLLSQEDRLFHQDVNEQWESRVKQKIGFHVAEALAIPAEYVIIELERIDLGRYLKI